MHLILNDYGLVKLLRYITTTAGLLVALGIASTATATGDVFLLGDFNGDGLVSEADYSVLGDEFGSGFGSPADANGDGFVDEIDFDIYVASFGSNATVLSALVEPTVSIGSGVSLEIDAEATPNETVLWTLTFNGVSSALAASLAIEVVEGNSILTSEGGPSFLDIGQGGGLPSLLSPSLGISIDNGIVLAALGTTLGESFSDDSLTFLTFETQGLAETTIELSGNVGVVGLDNPVTGSATFIPIPEPSALLLGTLATLALLPRCRR